MEKVGVIVLFEDLVKCGNIIGVVVNLVWIVLFKDFGNLDVVVDRFIVVECKKVKFYFIIIYGLLCCRCLIRLSLL